MSGPLKLTAQIDGVELANRALALLEPAVHDRVSKVVQEDADLAVQSAKARVHNVSGELASTIRKTSSEDGLIAWVQAGEGTLRRRSRNTGVKGDKRRAKTAANDAPGVYAMVVEFGDAKRNHAPHPYMIPAVESIRAQHQAKLEAALQDAVRDATGDAGGAS